MSSKRWAIIRRSPGQRDRHNQVLPSLQEFPASVIRSRINGAVCARLSEPPRASERHGICLARTWRFNAMKKEQLHELLYQGLETERGGIQVYRTALRCAQNDELREEWQEYLEQTRNHERILLEAFEHLGLDPETQSSRTTGRQAHRRVAGEGHGDGAASGTPEAAQAGRLRMRRGGRDQGSPQLGAARRGRQEGEGRRGQGAQGGASTRSRTRKTSTCTTARDGVVSCGSRRSA